MGTWGVGIKDNDDFMDFYDDIIEQFNEGNSFEKITNKMLDKYEDVYRDENDQLHNLYFALAYSGWECGYFDRIIFEKVKKIIKNGANLEIWTELGADNTTLINRGKALANFLEKIETKKEKPKKPKLIKFKPAVFEKGAVFAITLDDNTYSGAIVLEKVNEGKEHGSNLILLACLSSNVKPNVEDILSAKVYGYYWFSSQGYKKYSKKFEHIGDIDIKQVYSYGGIGSAYATWKFLVSVQNENYYLFKENSIFNSISDFVRFNSSDIEKIQKERVQNRHRT